jgi:hypothetical protein
MQPRKMRSIVFRRTSCPARILVMLWRLTPVALSKSAEVKQFKSSHF